LNKQADRTLILHSSFK